MNEKELDSKLDQLDLAMTDVFALWMDCGVQDINDWTMEQLNEQVYNIMRIAYLKGYKAKAGEEEEYIRSLKKELDHVWTMLEELRGLLGE